MNDDQLLRYSRHILLPELGVEGQERLLASHALIVGAGGLGSPAAMYLAAAGVGRITICDADKVDLTNLQRQIAHRNDSVGMPKVVSAKRTLSELNPEIDIVALEARLDPQALMNRVADCSVVLDCSDNFATRHAVNRACVAHRVPLVSGAAIRFDGQISVFDLRSADSPCYACLFSEDAQSEEMRCAVMGVFAPLTGIVGATQAAETIKLLSGAGRTLSGTSAAAA
jgi:adenylyltransferase/sulfurtransferase